MIKTIFVWTGMILAFSGTAQGVAVIKKKDRKKDVLLETSMGSIIIRLSDSTTLHRDNFLKLVKTGFYDQVLFHRVIGDFMIQAGDPDSRNAPSGVGLGSAGPGYTIPAEFRFSLFHKKGAVAAARQGDRMNPEKASSGSQFYIVQGKKFTARGLDSLEQFRLEGRKIPPAHRSTYQEIGGAPHLDQGYTVFGEVVEGLDVVDKIAGVKTSPLPADRDRPLEDVRILKAKLVKRKKAKRN